MAEMATYRAVEPVSVNLSAVAVTRGVRLTRASTGLCAVAGATIRGEYVALTAGAASESIMCAAIGAGGKVPAMASEAVAVGDDAYAAASGKFSKTSTNAAVMGRWTLAASADGVLGEVELSGVL